MIKKSEKLEPQELINKEELLVIAHELRNPLSYISNAVQSLEANLLDISEMLSKKPLLPSHNSEINENIACIKEGLYNINAVINGFDPTLQAQNYQQEVDINKTIDKALTLLSAGIGNNITIKKEYDNIPLVKFKPGALNQVFINLLKNSLEAIAAKNTSAKEYIHIRTELVDRYAVVSIKDSGIGIEKQSKEKLLAPYFSTKNPSTNSGLGLSITQTVLKNHGGEIRVYNTDNSGLEIILKIPILPKNPPID